MRPIIAFLAAVIGAGLLIRGVADWGLGFLAAAATLAGLRARLTPLRKIEAALAVGVVVAVFCRSVDGALGALALLLVFQLMKVIR
jgi:hypothetical protein